MTKFVGKTRLLAVAIGATSAFAAAGGEMAPYEDTQFDRMLPSLATPAAAQERDFSAAGAPYEDTQFDRTLPSLTAGTAAQERASAARGEGVAGPTAPMESAGSEQWYRSIPDPYLP